MNAAQGAVNHRAMTAPHGAAVVLTKEGYGRTIAARDIVPTVRAGQVVVVPHALQDVGVYEELVETIVNAIHDVCSSAAAEQCRRSGLERLHTVLDGAEVERAVHEADRRLARAFPRLMKALGRGALGLTRPFYINRSSLVRFMVPREAHSPNEERIMRRPNRGHLSGHPPHRDYWFFNPINSINVWMAIGAVEPGNGLLIYTDMWGREVVREGSFAGDADYGTPLTFALEAGDVAVFDNRHLHASALNRTASTRVVLSGRVCVEPPIAPRADALEATAYWSPLIGTPFERLAGPATKLSWAYVIERLKRRATSSIGAIELRTGRAPFRAAREGLRYRRADRPFGA
jgi:hypothetical protein